MAIIKHFLNEIQVSLNLIHSEIFEIICVDYQMSTSCGQDEPNRSLKKAYRLIKKEGGKVNGYNTNKLVLTSIMLSPI